MRTFRRNHGKLWTILYTTLLFVFTLYTILDTFVITRVYETVSETGSTSQIMTVSSSSRTESASDEISLQTYREYDSDIYVATIPSGSAAAVKTALAQNTYGKNVTAKTSEIADSVDAVLAINGDYYGARESGYVIRNGVLYRSEGSAGQEDLVIYQDGSFAIIDEGNVSAEELLEAGAVQVLSFGPALLSDGKICVSETDEVDRAMRSNPRTAIGILEDGSIVMVVSDGRTDESAGLSLYELAAFLKSLGVQTAYNLDGGGSSTMVYNGTVINNPTSGHYGSERSVSDIIYI